MGTSWIIVVMSVLQLVWFCPGAKATGIVEIKFVEFSNPTGKLFDGFCCDYKNFWSYDCAPCDHQFVVCLGNISKSSDMNSCEFDKVETGKVKSNQIEFTDDIGGVPNPIKIKFDTWPGFMKLKINTLDRDGLNTFDFVDHYEYQYFSSALSSSKNSMFQTLNLTGSSTSLKLELSVHCDENSFGPICDIICIPRDDEGGHYFCDPERGEKICLKGWSGDNCINNTDDCKKHQCQSGATCQDGIGFYTCLCPLGRTGEYCEGEINECSSLPCQNGGRCLDGMASFVCSCTANYTGERCERRITACDSQLCLNNGSCYSENFDDFNCTCVPGFSGKYCEVNNDECASNPCKNQAICVDKLNGYECQCLPGYAGIQCEVDIDECESNPCQNGGTCKNLLNIFKCFCSPGTTGETCENDINECQVGPCSGNGNCTNTFGSYHCSCFPGFSGEHCHLRDPCFFFPCKNNGSCLPIKTNTTDNNYTCACAPGFNGTDCESDIDECVESQNSDGTGLCTNGGSCVNTVGSFECNCRVGFTGSICEVASQTTDSDTFTELMTTEDDNMMSATVLDKNIVVIGETERTTIDYSSTTMSEPNAAIKTSSPSEMKMATTKNLQEGETERPSTMTPNIQIFDSSKENTTVFSSPKISQTTNASAYISSNVTATETITESTESNVTVGETITESIESNVTVGETIIESTQSNLGAVFGNVDNFFVIEQAHVPIELTTKRPTVNVVTDCILIKIYGTTTPEQKLEGDGAKKEICWLVYDSIAPPLADVDVTITRNKDEAYRWIARTLEDLMPIVPRPFIIEKESQAFLKEFQMFLNGFSRYRSVNTDDNSPLNSQCLQVLIKTKRKGRGYFKNRPNNPYVRYIRKFKSLPRSLASKMILCKTSYKGISTSPRPMLSTMTKRRTTLQTKLQTSTHTTLLSKQQTSTRTPVSAKPPIKKFKIILQNLNSTHVQKRFYYPQKSHVLVTNKVVAPTITVTILRSARKIFEAGSKKAEQAYRETKILLHKTLRRLSSLWTSVHRISNVMYIPVAHSREMITRTWNTAWSKAQIAYSAARSVIQGAYQKARENFRIVYNRLKEQASHLSRRYYQLYREYYNEYTWQVNNAAEKFVDTYDSYTSYLTQYWKKYIKGDEAVDIMQPPDVKENPFISNNGRRKRTAQNQPIKTL